jgi:hypothetical protein
MIKLHFVQIAYKLTLEPVLLTVQLAYRLTLESHTETVHVYVFILFNFVKNN